MNSNNGLVDTLFLKSLMLVNNLSESEFADKIGVSHSMVNRVINGKRGGGKKVILGILRAFEGVRYDQIIHYDNSLTKGNKIKKKKESA